MARGRPTSKSARSSDSKRFRNDALDACFGLFSASVPRTDTTDDDDAVLGQVHAWPALQWVPVAEVRAECSGFPPAPPSSPACKTSAFSRASSLRRRESTTEGCTLGGRGRRPASDALARPGELDGRRWAMSRAKQRLLPEMSPPLRISRRRVFTEGSGRTPAATRVAATARASRRCRASSSSSRVLRGAAMARNADCVVETDARASEGGDCPRLAS